jgi:hypothetical protein
MRSKSKMVKMGCMAFPVVELIDKVAEQFKQSHIGFDQPVPTNDHIKQLADFFKCTEKQASLFSVVFALNFRSKLVDVETIADYIGISTVKVAALLPEFQVLVAQNILRRKGNSKKGFSLTELGFYIPKTTFDSIFQESPSNKVLKTSKDVFELLQDLADVIEQKEDQEISFNEMVTDITNLLEAGKGFYFVKQLKQLRLKENEQLFLLKMVTENIGGKSVIFLADVCESLYESKGESMRFMRDVLQGKTQLITKKLIKLEDAMFRGDYQGVTITELGAKHLLGEDSKLFAFESKEMSNLRDSSKIPVKQLFFNPDTQDQMDFLSGSLQSDNLSKIQNRLKESGLRQGMNILFYGPAGTGKTESVLQLAKATNRAIFMVESSQVKSMWYGQSERNLKELFNHYREAMRYSKETPILLFNEADALLSKRINISQGADQTSNAIQNILLQELEDMEGIMIATTNLTTNLDKAFERRFLYKIKFDKPEPAVRANIWKDKLPFLSGQDAAMLANKYDFSGAQMENIARKCVMGNILYDKNPDIRIVDGYCQEENIETNRKLGF